MKEKDNKMTEATRLSQFWGVFPVEVFCPDFKGFKQFEI